MTANPVFFVCGTPRDRIGFESSALDGKRLPDVVANKIDGLSQKANFEPGRPAHFCYPIETGCTGAFSAIYAEYCWIQPSDTPHNRGAYIAAGYWTDAPLDDLQALAALVRVEFIHGDLADRRDDNHSFSPDFSLRDYAVSASADFWDQSEKLSRHKSELENCGILTGTAPEYMQALQDVEFLDAREGREPYGLAEETTGSPVTESDFPLVDQRQPQLHQFRLERRGWWMNMTESEMVLTAIGLILWGALSIGVFLAVRSLLG